MIKLAHTIFDTRYLESVSLPQGAKVEFSSGDFFSKDIFPEGKQFDLIYDHT
jgi:hypothetical protein